MHQQGKQEALCIGDHVRLRPLTRCRRQIRATATFCGFDALAIDDTSRRNSVTAHRQPSAPHQRKIDPRPDALIPPKIEVVLNGEYGGKSLAAIATGIRSSGCRGSHSSPPADQLHAGVRRGRAVAGKGQQQPFRLRRIACITQPVAQILLAGDFSPYHCDLHRFSQIRRNHKGLKSLNSFSVSLSG